MTTSSMQFGQSAISVVLGEGTVPAKFATNSTGAVTGLSDPVSGSTILTSKGEIALYAPDDYVGGVAQGTGQTIASSVLAGNSNGTPLTWSASLFDTTNGGAGGAWSAADPSKIVVPVGATRARFTGSIIFPVDATKTGSRWARLSYGSTPTHCSNVILPVASAVVSQPVPISTGWIDVVAGMYFELRALQDSGSSMTLAMGNSNNRGGSNFFRAEFK